MLVGINGALLHIAVRCAGADLIQEPNAASYAQVVKECQGITFFPAIFPTVTVPQLVDS